MTGFSVRSGEERFRKRRIVVAMSGGVDSSVAAAVLKEQGHEVIGVTLKLRSCNDAQESRSCCGADAIVRARAVAERLEIPHFVLDCIKEFERGVLRPAWEEYAAGRTPSPCLLCNERIKFGLLVDWARRMGAEQTATGHYARVIIEPGRGPVLLRGIDDGKDQSYFLAGLNPKQLNAVVFPVGKLHKSAVRALGRLMGLPNADVRESRDACLVGPDRSFAEMLRKRFSGIGRSGVIVDEDGRILGHHAGIHNFTIGQRKGLPGCSSGRRWVKQVRSEVCSIVVTGRRDGLLSRNMVAGGMNWLAKPPGDGKCKVQVRYRQKAVDAVVSLKEKDTVEVFFQEPVFAVTPGQAAVFYDRDRVLGMGWIHG